MALLRRRSEEKQSTTTADRRRSKKRFFADFRGMWGRIFFDRCFPLRAGRSFPLRVGRGFRFELAEVFRIALAEGSRFASADVARATGWAGACFHGSRASESGLDGRIPRAFNEDSTCACRHGAPGTAATRRDALDDPVRLRNKPLPTLPRRHLGVGRKSSSVFEEECGIDGPSRPRRCPRPAAWQAAGPDANDGPARSRSFS
jgi:hypothetical protein